MRLPSVLFAVLFGGLFAAPALAAEPGPAPEAPAIPEAFQGVWYSDLKGCDPRFDVTGTGLSIGKAWLNYRNRSSGPVRRVHVLGPREIEVVAVIEDHWWPAETRTVAFRLSEDGERLTEVPERGAEVVRERCPG
jgi:hypothetical protein